MLPTTHRRGPIGLDLGGRCIKAAQLARTSGGWRLAAAATLPRPEASAPIDRKLAARLREALYRQGFTGTAVVAAAPVGDYHAEVLDLPPRASGAPIDQIARAELARCAEYESAGFEMAHWDLPAPARGGGGTAVMAVGMPHATADALLDALGAEGLNVESLDVPAWALARAVGNCRPGPGGVTAVLDIGWSAALLVLVQDGVVLYQRAIPEGGAGLLYREVMARFELTEEVAGYLLTAAAVKAGVEDSARSSWVSGLAQRHADAIAQEVAASLAYTTHRYPDLAVESILLTGGGADVAGTTELLKARLEMEVRPVAVGDLVECPPDVAARCPGAALVSAVGLAMGGRAS